MRITVLSLSICALLASVPTSAFAQVKPCSMDLTAARKSMAGIWEGKLEYLDYTANEWFGIPVMTVIEDQGDNATLIRKSDFDDGLKVGNVRITTVEIFDATTNTLTVGGFRKGRTPDLTTYTARFEGEPSDEVHWTMIEETDAKDDNRPARLRLTTVRDGARLQTLKQVDFLDDAKQEWLSRNRITLNLVK
jgi:hypothetical protein